MTDWDAYRKLFPHLPEQVYLNHAGIAPLNSRAREAMEKLLHLRNREDIEFWPAALEEKEHLKTLIGQLINAPAENIALTPNTSAGLNILALGLEWQPGDRVLLNNFEFPSNVIPFRGLKRLGVELDFVKHREGRLLLEDIEAHIHPRTRLLSISFVEFLNGFRNDLKAIGEMCRQHDIIFCVDAIQGLGALQMDVQEMHIDFLSTSGHKWLMWPAGIGFVYISPRIFEQLYPAIAGWLGVQTPYDFFNYFQDWAPDARRFETGTFNTLGIVGARASLEMMLEIGTATIQQKVLENTDYLMQCLPEAGYRLYSPTEPEHRSGIVTFFHPRAEELYQHLHNRKIFVSLREGKIRVSPHFYNNREDIDRFLEAVRKFDAAG